MLGLLSEQSQQTFVVTDKRRPSIKAFPSAWAEPSGRQMLRARPGGEYVMGTEAGGQLCHRVSTLADQVLSFQLMKEGEGSVRLVHWRGFIPSG